MPVGAACRQAGTHALYNRSRVPRPAAQPAATDPAAAELAAESQLVRALQSGDAAAWPVLIQRYQDRLFSVCLRMVRDRDLAADLTQDTLVKIIQGIGSYDGRSRLSTWMHRVAMNVCLSKLRAEKLRRHASLDRVREGAAGESPGLSGGFEQSRELGAPRGVEEHEDRERVMAALGELDPDQRAVLILCDCRGMAYEQIAEVLDIAVGTVKSRVFRARAALRDVVERLARRGA